MGQLILTNAVQALCDAGIPTERGYPAGKVRMISEPVCAVSLKKADLPNKTLTVLASVLSPAELGAAVCEETALEAGEVLGQLGGRCTVAECRQDGRTGLYAVEVTAEFATEKTRVEIDDDILTHVVSFTSWRTLEEGQKWMDAQWSFQLEEYFPMGETLPPDLKEEFTLTHVCVDGTESYVNSTWNYQHRQWDAGGVRQIRRGTAAYMADG